MLHNDSLKEHKVFCETRITEFQNRVAQIAEIQSLKDFCIYATGSYARKEASRFSDLDLFFVDCSGEGGSVPNLSKMVVDGELIKMVRMMTFPDFSGDGQYLQIHKLTDLIDQLGSQEDDHRNFFTARLLLLLESCCIHNPAVYDKSLKQIINRYYVDFHDHMEDFKPMFLANDIIRFWKTLTINYEHRRHRKPDSAKPKSHVNVLKLRFSRKLTCFSFLIQILSRSNVLSIDDIVIISKLTPLERLVIVGNENKNQESTVGSLLELYAWFVEAISREKSDLYAWIMDKKNRDDAFNKSREFSNLIFELLRNCDRNDLFKYLVM